METTLIFSYGSLQQPDVQLSTFGRLLAGTPDEILRFRLSRVPIEDPAVAAALGKTEHADVIFTSRDDDRVSGMAFEVGEEELAAVDEYERAFAYERVAAHLASGRRAWVYVHRADEGSH